MMAKRGTIKTGAMRSENEKGKGKGKGKGEGEGERFWLFFMFCLI